MVSSRNGSAHDHGEGYRRARAASTRRGHGGRFVHHRELRLVVEGLDLDTLRRGVVWAPPARFDAEGGLLSGSSQDWGPWETDLDYSDGTMVERGRRRPAPRLRSWLHWLLTPRGQTESAFQTPTWEAKRREQQVAEAKKAAVVFLAYSTAAFGWWLVHLW
jgi:hypothetical protein